jgi:hypothetical protein
MEGTLRGWQNLQTYWYDAILLVVACPSRWHRARGGYRSINAESYYYYYGCIDCRQSITITAVSTVYAS